MPANDDDKRIAISGAGLPGLVEQKSSARSPAADQRHATSGAGLPGLSRRTRRASSTALLDSLESAYDGRDGVCDALSASADPRAARLATMLSDPQWRGKSLADTCYDADLAPSTVLMLLRDGAVTRAIAEAHLRLQARLPAVVDRIADSAEGTLTACHCTIGGQRAALPDCGTCAGTGKKPQVPSLPHQQLMLDVLGLTSKGGTQVAVNVQQQAVVATTGVFDAFVKSGTAVTLSRGDAGRLAASPRPAGAGTAIVE